MFTGLIEEIGTIQAVQSSPEGRRFKILAPGIQAELAVGDSIACNGVCLTVEQLSGGRSGLHPGAGWGNRSGGGLFQVFSMQESLHRTTAGRWRPGRRLHLERALAVGDRMGGHLVQGHVDGEGSVVRAGREGREFALAIRLPHELRRYVVRKGSLAVDGVSLTVGAMAGSTCRLYLIPETLERTLLGRLRSGDLVNLEVDLVAKYVETLIPREARERLE